MSIRRLRPWLAPLALVLVAVGVLPARAGDCPPPESCARDAAALLPCLDCCLVDCPDKQVRPCVSRCLEVFAGHAPPAPSGPAAGLDVEAAVDVSFELPPDQTGYEQVWSVPSGTVFVGQVVAYKGEAGNTSIEARAVSRAPNGDRHPFAPSTATAAAGRAESGAPVPVVLEGGSVIEARNRRGNGEGRVRVFGVLFPRPETVLTH